jgi:hypothetical protein
MKKNREKSIEKFKKMGVVLTYGLNHDSPLSISYKQGSILSLVTHKELNFIKTITLKEWENENTSIK